MPDDDPFAPPVPREVTPRKGYVFDPAEPIPEAMQPPPPPPQPRGRLKDVDSSETAYKLRAAVMTFRLGILGSLLGAAVGSRMGGGAFVVMLLSVLGFFVGWGLSYLITMRVADAAGRTAASLYMPTGSSTPMDRQYSLAQSYVARGKFAEAAAEYERCSNLYPDDPEPCIRLARLYRDDLHRFDDAVLWFKRTTAVPGLPAGTDMMAMRELIEVYTHRLRTPAAALPHLARLSARHPGTTAGDWARRELAEMKAQMRAQEP